ncbi:hypothetical protein PUN28_008966 [Cardiocondyla obscurior]|uniref:Uncharacterized protein n=1 Tax=Cardiocondyla obscurior TaxID=286306 RepID=A0AAW2FVJ4_9HYME
MSLSYVKGVFPTMCLFALIFFNTSRHVVGYSSHLKKRQRDAINKNNNGSHDVRGIEKDQPAVHQQKYDNIVTLLQDFVFPGDVPNRTRES